MDGTILSRRSSHYPPYFSGNKKGPTRRSGNLFFLNNKVGDGSPSGGEGLGASSRSDLAATRASASSCREIGARDTALLVMNVQTDRADKRSLRSMVWRSWGLRRAPTGRDAEGVLTVSVGHERASAFVYGTRLWMTRAEPYGAGNANPGWGSLSIQGGAADRVRPHAAPRQERALEPTFSLADASTTTGKGGRSGA